jgi:DNA-directed RNA polymerase omega subunit
VNNAYLERAKKIIVDPKVLSIVAAKRAKQLALGGRPMVKCTSDNVLDVALLEIAEGKLYFEYGPEEAVAQVEDIFSLENVSTEPENKTE